MANVGYARVSREDQEVRLQLDALTQADCVKIFTEKASGAQLDRPAFLKALDYVRPGDTLVVWKLDRLARSLRQLIDTAERLQAQDIGLRSLTESLDTGTPGGMFIFHMFGALAQFERAIIRERTTAGLDAARARGRVGGRPRKVTRGILHQAMVLMADPESKVGEVAALLGINRTVLYRYVNGDGSLKPLGRRLLGGSAGETEADAAD